MDLVESKIACHLHKVRLLGSCPIKTCIIHYPPSTSHKNFKPNSHPKQNPLKRATAEDSDFQLPTTRNTVKAPTFFSPNAISTSNKFMNLDNLTEPDPPLPQTPKSRPSWSSSKNTPAEETEQELSDLNFKNSKVT
ncbi:hypothetical protein CEXT_532131 [Caerostris extrusa]|uniref:Uncharacterized protein n=1 Tax=Caerostris extrusa TaxID=172846 RepID=A0AAV4PXR9_CAEEX|nr:hypothetical protein CEXT_532131 [Caerostris extrusa]